MDGMDVKMRRAVIGRNLTTGEMRVFESIMEAERQTGTNNGNISLCIRGLKASAGGYKWAYTEVDLDSLEVTEKKRGRPNKPPMSKLEITVTNDRERYTHKLKRPLDDSTGEVWAEEAAKFISDVFTGRGGKYARKTMSVRT